MKVEEIFRKEELDYLSKKKPDLVPMDVPSLSDAKTLSQPSLDQIIVQFLQQYEVNVEPRSVGKWNGWDTVSTISSLLSSSKGSMSNIASTIFYANRSNQINSAAQDWGTWKRWVFDSKEREFEQFKNELIQTINIYNNKIIAETEEQIRKAQINNQKVFKALQETSAKNYINELIKKNQIIKKNQQKIIGLLIGSLIFGVTFLAIFLSIFDRTSGNYQKRKEDRISSIILKADEYKREYRFFQNSVNTYKEVLKLDPDWDRTQKFIENGDWEFEKGGYGYGDHESALFWYKEALKLDSNLSEVKRDRFAKIYFNNGNKTFNRLGNDRSLASLGEWDDAINWYKEALKLDPDIYGVHYNIGLTYYRKLLVSQTGSTENAINCKGAMFHLGKINKQDKTYNSARKMIETIKEQFLHCQRYL